MSTLAVDVRESLVLIRDLRHESARAASDLADWLTHLELEGKTAGTLYQYCRQVAPLLREHPHKELTEFTHTDINDALAEVPRRSRHITRSIYNGFFGWAEWDERIDRNPMGRVVKIRPPRRRPTSIFSLEEVALLEALPSPHGQLFTVLFGTGLRRGEAIGLRRDHVDLANARVVVYQGKGDKDRIIPVTATVLAALADLELGQQIASDEFVWACVRSQRHQKRWWRTHPVGSSTFDRWYRDCITAAGVRYLNPHQCRHTYGHLLREKGFDIEERQLLMGHEAITTTQRYYGHLTIEDVARKVAAL